MLRQTIGIQSYRVDIPGDTEAEKIRNWFTKYDALDPLHKRAVRAVLPHGFMPEFTPAKFLQWAAAADLRDHMEAGAAWGVSNILDPTGKGTFYGQVAQLPQCKITLLDIETHAWEGDGAAAAADALCQAFRALAKRATLIMQTWHVPTGHPDPYTTFMKYIEAFMAMWYCNEQAFKDQYGVDRYWICDAWFAQSWANLRRNTLVPARNAQKPRRAVPPLQYTLQSYGWDDIIPDLVQALLSTDDGPTILWEQKSGPTKDWWPPQSTWIGIGRYQALVERGFTGLNAVWDFQSTQPQLTIDGICGNQTAAALGVP